MIIITGASSGVGKFLFQKFVDSGQKVIGTFFHSQDYIDGEDNLYKVDISNVKSVCSWQEKIIDDINQLVLINCAGINYNSYAHKADYDAWRGVIEVNLIGTFNVIRTFLPIMRKQNYGRIINFSSVTAQTPTAGVSAYAASKSALWGMSKSLSVENGRNNITINNINLGYANIGMGLNEVPQKLAYELKKRIPSMEFCNPDDVFATVNYLIQTSYLNGASIDLNGGLI